MISRRLKFPGQGRGERINLFFRRHPLSFLGFSLIGLMMIILPIIVFIVMISSGFLFLEPAKLDHEIAVAIFSAYFLFCLGLLLVAWINYYLDIYIVTDRRIIDINQEGLFSRSLSAIDLVDVEDVKANVEGFLCTFFNYGDVFVQTAGETQNIDFHQVPDPYTLGRKIMDYHEQAVRREAREQISDIRKNSQSRIAPRPRRFKPRPAIKPPQPKIEAPPAKPRPKPEPQPKPEPKPEPKKEEIDRDRLKKGGKIDL